MSASCEQVITLAGDLHARPAGALAVAAGRFAAAVSVTAGGHTADAKSVLGVMSLGATSGQHVTVSAAGPDAQEAVATLIAILTQATKVGGLLNAARRTGKARARKCQVADEWCLAANYEQRITAGPGPGRLAQSQVQGVLAS